jgi:hypothetical protein
MKTTRWCAHMSRTLALLLIVRTILSTPLTLVHAGETVNLYDARQGLYRRAHDIRRHDEDSFRKHRRCFMYSLPIATTTARTEPFAGSDPSLLGVVPGL